MISKSVMQQRVKNFEEYLININQAIHNITISIKDIPAPFTNQFTVYYYQKEDSEITVGFINKINGDIYSAKLNKDSRIPPTGNVNSPDGGKEYIDRYGLVKILIHQKSSPKARRVNKRNLKLSDKLDEPCKINKIDDNNINNEMLTFNDDLISHMYNDKMNNMEVIQRVKVR